MLSVAPLGSETLSDSGADAPTAHGGESPFSDNTGLVSYQSDESALQGSAFLPRFTSAEELEEYLVEDALERYRDLFGQPVDWPRYYMRDGDPIALDTLSVVEGDLDHSDTNTQVSGVDEADLVETDGNYLYVLSDQELVILNSWPADELEVASRVRIDGRPVGEYLYGDRLTVLSSVDRYIWEPEPVGAPFVVADWVVPYRPPSLKVTILDVSDREAPVLVQETELDGWLVDSRSIDGSVLLVTRDDFGLPGPELVPVTPAEDDALQGVDHEDGGASREGNSGDLLHDPWVEEEYVFETEAQYLARIEGRVLDLALPHFSSYGSDGSLAASGLLSEPTDIYRPLSPDDGSLVSVVVFDASSDTPGPKSSTSVPFSYVSEVYASRESLYLMKYAWQVEGETSILKFDYDASSGDVDLSAKGTVPGRVLNQFSVDEYGGYLRIATTRNWGDDARNDLYVLQQNGGDLEIVGRLEDLTPGEQIYSARFMGDRAFVVTFRVIDPLLGIDLSDPTDPQLRGELEIPGFSNYLHPVGKDFLIGIGRIADEETGQLGPPQVSLFDVGDLGNPTLVDRFTMDVGAWGWSEAFNDHHAVGYFPEYQVLTLPVSSAGRWVVDEHGQEVYLGPRTDLWVFRIDVDTPLDGTAADTGIRLLGRIDHDLPVRRSARVEDLLYVVSADTASAHPILDPESEIARLTYRMNYLEPVDFLELVDRDLRTSELWYSFRTTHEGLVTLEAELRSGPDSVNLTLYDEDFNQVAAATSVGQSPRIDWQTDADAAHYLQVSPVSEETASGALFDLRLANLVQQDGDTLTVHGTDGEDRFEFNAVAPRTITINGTLYPIDDTVRSVTFDGAAGYDTAVFHGSPEDQEVTIWPLSATTAAGALTVDVDGTEKIVALGGGGRDVAHMHGGAGADTYLGTSTFGRLVGDGFFQKVSGFHDIHVHSGGGADLARLKGAVGDDTLSGDPTSATLSGAGFMHTVEDFTEVHAFGDGDGNDTAVLTGTAGNDTLVARAGNVSLFDSGYQYDNASRSFQALGDFTGRLTATQFGSVTVTSNEGRDAAYFMGSVADDTFTVTPTEATFEGGGHKTTAVSFSKTNAYGKQGHDQAYFSGGPEKDTFHVTWAYGRMWGGSEEDGDAYLHRAVRFDEVEAAATPGGDVALLYAGPYHDRLEGTTTETRWMLGYQESTQTARYEYVARDFPVVKAWGIDSRGRESGSDRARLQLGPGDQFKPLGPGEAKLSDDSCLVWVQAFGDLDVEAAVLAGASAGVQEAGSDDDENRAVDQVLQTEILWLPG
jgi:uncharacterized secreted protein with C-terminal beta-propeller domain